MKKLDLHGQIASLAQINLQTFIKECYMQRNTVCVVVHGYGEYVLKEMCWQYLSTNPMVESYSIAPIGLGGAGATLVHIKNKPSTKKN